MSPKTNWEELYSDLSPRVAKALRDARVKPDQLVTMSDGEITSLDGIGDVALEEIRSKYQADIEKEVKAEGPAAQEEVAAEEGPAVLPPNKRHLFRDSRRYKKAKTLVDRTKTYDLEEAVELLKKANIARFNATITLHLNLKEKISRVEVNYPFSTGVTKRIVIATDEVLEQINKGVIDFDILVTTPAMMPKLARFARVLGPKGLMPNPKTGTVTPNPEAKKKELESGKAIVAAEPKMPLMHATVGKIEQETKEIIGNIEALVEAVKVKNILKATIVTSMSPGIKIRVS